MSFMTSFYKARLGLTTMVLVFGLAVLKYFLYTFGFELLPMSSLYTSAIGGAFFVLGFLLAGVFADYKEAERAPAELRSALESVWEDVRSFKDANPEFDLEAARTALRGVVQGVFAGLSHGKGHAGMGEALESMALLSPVFAQMERLGMPANHVVRLKSERSIARKILLRIEHIQRIQFVPSVYFLIESIVVLAVSLLLFLKTENPAVSLALFGFISYIFIYVSRIISVLEQPFRQGHDTKDDVSLFLLHGFEEDLKK